MGASEPEVAHDPERPCREAEAPHEATLILQAVSWYLGSFAEEGEILMLEHF